MCLDLNELLRAGVCEKRKGSATREYLEDPRRHSRRPRRLKKLHDTCYVSYEFMLLFLCM
jgi:hypothetical protein